MVRMNKKRYSLLIEDIWHDHGLLLEFDTRDDAMMIAALATKFLAWIYRISLVDKETGEEIYRECGKGDRALKDHIKIRGEMHVL